MNRQDEFNKLLNSLDGSKSVCEVFNDFLTMTVYSLAQTFYRSQSIENRYSETAKKYKKEQLDIFA